MREFNLFRASTITIIALIITVTINIVIAMSTTSKPDNLAIEEAAKSHTNLFIIYILSLVVTVIFSVLVWKSSNKYQDAVQHNADAQIATAKATAEVAIVDATKAKEKIKELEQLNLTLEGDVAKLQIKAADAQRALLELQERLKPRRLTAEQAEYLVATIKDKSPGDIWLSCKSSDEEACNLGQQLFKILKSANWRIFNNRLQDVTIYTENVSSTVGIVITINKNLKSVPSGIELFNKTMLQIGFVSRIERSSKESVEILIGAKPQI